MRQDLRVFLKEYEAAFPDNMLYIDEEIDRQYEPTALILELERQMRYPIVVFNNIKGSQMPVVANILASRKSMAVALNISEKELPGEYARRIKNDIEPVYLQEIPPFMDNTFQGQQIDLYQLPVITHYKIDAGPYITGGLVVAKDPVTGVDTCGYHRLQLKDKDKLGISLHSRKRLWEFFRRAEERGTNLEAAIVLGVHPVYSMGSMAIVPIEQSKYAKIGGLLGEGVQLANCSTIDVQVPFWAEIVIEGEILANTREGEGPFGEFTNYACSRSTENVFKVKAISYRNNALYQSITGGMSAEHNLIMAVQREGDLIKALREGLPNIKDVNVPLSGCGFFHCYISMKKTAQGQPMQAILKALSIDHNLKLVVVVDADIDVFNENEVLWSIATRVQADKDVLIIPQHMSMGCTLDPSSDEYSRSAKMGIDATKPTEDFPGKLNFDEVVTAKMRKLISRL